MIGASSRAGSCTPARSPPAHHRWPAGTRRLHAAADPDLRHHKPVADPSADVRARLDDGQVMVPNKAASFAIITPDSMGRASTFFNTMRQVGQRDGRRHPVDGARIRRGLGPPERAGTRTPDITAYHLAFGLRFIFALVAVVFSLSIERPRRGRDRSCAAPTKRVRPVPSDTVVPCSPAGSVGAPTVRLFCVFGGSSVGVQPRLRRRRCLPPRDGGLAARGVGLVYGGASVGLMGVVADAAIAAGGSATGVITEALAGHETRNGTSQRAACRHEPCTSARR